MLSATGSPPETIASNAPNAAKPTATACLQRAMTVTVPPFVVNDVAGGSPIKWKKLLSLSAHEFAGKFTRERVVVDGLYPGNESRRIADRALDEASPVGG